MAGSNKRVVASLLMGGLEGLDEGALLLAHLRGVEVVLQVGVVVVVQPNRSHRGLRDAALLVLNVLGVRELHPLLAQLAHGRGGRLPCRGLRGRRSEEHTSELQSHYSISYAVFCLKKPSI